MEIFLKFILNLNKFVNALLVAITAVADVIAVIQFIKSKQKTPIKVFVIIFFTIVLLILAVAPFIKEVPNVVGYSYKEAKNIILKAGFIIDDDDFSEEMIVSAQSPEAGRVVLFRKNIKLQCENNIDETQTYLVEAETLAASGDYLGAYKILNGKLANSSNVEVIAKKTEYIQNYKEVLFAEAEKSYIESGYKAAVSYLQENLSDYEDDEIHEKIEYYESKRPINLLAENTFIGDKEKFLSDYGEKVDSLGNTYLYKLECGDITKQAYYVCYALDGKYTTLNFDLALNAEYKSSDTVTTWIEIYDENGNLLLETEHLGAGSRPIEELLDITGVNELYIYAWHTGSGEYGMKYDFALTNGFWVSK